MRVFQPEVPTLMMTPMDMLLERLHLITTVDFAQAEWKTASYHHRGDGWMRVFQMNGSDNGYYRHCCA